MSKVIKSIMTAIFLAFLAGCVAKKPMPIPVVVSDVKPDIPQECKRDITPPKDVPVGYYERKAFERWPTLSDEDRKKLLKQHSKRIVQLLKYIINDRKRDAIERRRISVCRKWIIDTYGGGD